LRGTASPSTSTCPNGGLLTITLTDRDGGGVASAGDRISVDARACAVPVITDIVTGRMAEVNVAAGHITPGATLLQAASAACCLSGRRAR
jgi:hypothetical protein